jgi:23S rRNA (uracil1939-C5)-methyltransferase
MAATEAVVEKLVAGGRGLARLDGRAVFVPFAVPGERVRLEILKERKDFLEARITGILEPSVHRQEAPCRLYGLCGGCDLMHIRYPEQLRWKVLLAREALGRTGGLDWPQLEIAAAEPYAYRSRVQLHRDREGRPGFMRRESSEVIAVSRCPVCVPAVNRLLENPGGDLFASARRTRLTVFAAGRCLIEGRDKSGSLKIAGRTIRFRVSSFFQSNLLLLPELLRDVTANLSGRCVLDLYSGVGLFGALLAESFDRVISLERDAAALSLARGNIPGRGHLFIRSEADRWAVGREMPAHLDAVVADPPRSGLSAPVRSWLIAARVPRLVYVSCDIVTLARDLKALLAGGYELTGLKLYDFNPQTSRLEAVAHLRCAPR